jgi:adenosylcobinamide amidohydrolase
MKNNQGLCETPNKNHTNERVNYTQSAPNPIGEGVNEYKVFIELQINSVNNEETVKGYIKECMEKAGLQNQVINIEVKEICKNS